MKTCHFVLLSLVALAACSPSVPDSGKGVGFQDYNSYMRNSTAGQPMVSAVAPAAGFNPADAAAAIDRAEGTSASAPLVTGSSTYAANTAAASVYAANPAVANAVPGTGIRPRGGAPMGIQEQNGEIAGIAGSHANISDENDFNAVAARETIQSDAQRIAQNRSQYVVVQPRDLPQRAGDSGPNIVEYALATKHAPGVQMYSRSGRKSSEAACAKFTSSDQAQQQFLAKGGPDRDRLGVDSDGDGFACSWDPRPFRKALQ